MPILRPVVVPLLLCTALAAQAREWPYSMDYGPYLMTTLQAGGLCGSTPKAVVVRLAHGAVAFDTELLRVACAWTDGWLNLRGTAYDGAHGPMCSPRGRKVAETKPGPGWAKAGSFADPRPIPFGPLPAEHGAYRGLWLAGDTVVVGYTIDGMDVREGFGTAGDGRIVVRTLELGPSAREQVLVVEDGPDGAVAGSLAMDGPARIAMLQWQPPAGKDGVIPGLQHLACGLRGDQGPTFDVQGNRILLRVPGHERTLRVQLLLAAGDEKEIAAATPELVRDGAVGALPNKPGAARWGEPIVTQGVLGRDEGPFAVDAITIPFDNRFGSRMRTGAFDFFADGRAAVSTWNGDVWIVSGLDADLDRLEWKRFATGLFDPLGLRIVDGVVHVHGRDGITRLHDENGDGEADFYECFNNQVLVTPAFHEFSFDLQTDAEGNFYFSKGAPVNPGGRGFQQIVPHHGAILKVGKDGKGITTVATGLRAPNGIGVSKDGVITSGDNEGTFMPRCRLNWIEAPGFYGGVRDTAHRSPVPEQPDLPLCWMPMEVDNSSGGQVWVTGAGWRDLDGRLLHLSYGTCSVYLVLAERVAGRMQGGLVRLPAEFSSSCMRGRFSAQDGQLYVVGLQGWQTSAAKEGGFHRVRRTTAPLGLPVGIATCDKGVYLTFDEALDEETAGDPQSFGVEVWNYLYSPNYGSPELSVLHPERKVEQGKPNRDALPVTAAKLSTDRRTVFLAIDGMRPVHQMKITWNVDTKDGRTVKGELHNSIHALQTDPGFPVGR
jgi:hypothetical protein